MPTIDPSAPESGIEALLAAPDSTAEDLRACLAMLYQQYTAQQRLLDRLTRISDQFQALEREHGRSRIENYERKVKQIERIVRISDRYQGMLRELNNRLVSLSTHDELTGLPNRRYANERIEREINLAERSNGQLIFALADLDHFKLINDHFGHQTGDAVLVSIARALQANLRDYDTCARWGGEEFLILLPQTDLTAANALCERLRLSVAALPPPPVSNARDLSLPTLSISIGLSAFRPGEAAHVAISRIDDALYQAKTGGRNQIVCIP